MQRGTSHNPTTCWILQVCHVCISLHEARRSEVGIPSLVLIYITDSVCNIKQVKYVVSGRHHRFSHIIEMLLAELIYAYEALKLFLRSQCSSMKRNFSQVPEVLGSRGTEAINQCSYRVRALCLSERQAYTKVKKLFIPAVIGNFCI